MNIASNLDLVRERMTQAARRASRDPADILLVAVTKTVGVDEMKTATEHEVKAVGENRVEAALEKHVQLDAGVSWHMIGNLQRRKVRDAVRIFDVIHSVDSVALANEIDKRCAAIGKIMPVLMEVNVSGEESKHGFTPDELADSVRAASALENIRIEGLMTMAPFHADAEATRPVFRGLRKLAGEIDGQKIYNVSMKRLSMGMTNDFEVAIEEGSTMVRIGTAIFS